MAFTKINAAGIGTTETVTVDGLTVINDGSFGGNLTVGGVLTYEDVTNVDSVGLITARNGIVVGSGITLSKDGDIFATGITTVSGNIKVGTGITLSPDGDGFFTGVVTATSFVGDGSGLTNAGPSLTGSTNNTVVTVTGANAIQGEANLTYDGNVLALAGNDNQELRIGAGADLTLKADGSNSVIAHNGDGELAILSQGTDENIKVQSSGYLYFRTGGSNERLRIDSNGKILAGTTSSRAVAGGSAKLQVEATSSEGVSITRTSADSGAVYLSLGKTRNGSVCQAGDTIGSISWNPDDGTDLNHAAAEIQTVVESGIGGDDVPGALVFKTNGGATTTTERLRIDSSGRALIGRNASRNVGGSTTYAKLQVAGTSQSDSSISLVNNENDTKGPFVFFGKTRGGSVGSSTIVQNGDTLGGLSFIGADGNDTNNRTAEITAVVNGGPGNNEIPTDLTFSTSATHAGSLVERMRIYSTGKILIGNGATEQSPSGNLDIVGDVNSNGPELYLRVNNNNITDNIGALIFGNNVDKSVCMIRGSTHTANNTGDIEFHTSTTGTMTERLRIASNGLVSVLTNGLKLENATATNSRAFSITNASGTTGWSFGNGVTASSHQFVIYDNTAGAARITIDSEGKIGHNKAASGCTLDVEPVNNTHAMRANGAQAGYATLICDNRDSSGTRHYISFRISNGVTGKITSTGSSTVYGTTSDYRLKENVTAISDGITRLKTLKPSRFNWKSDSSTTVDGFLAHEVTAVPEAVVGTKDEVDSDNNPVYQAIDEGKLVPLLTAALQEAIAKIETLETKVAALEG